MSRKQQDKGRMPDFVPLYKATMRTAAWRALSHGARSLFVALKGRYHTKLQKAVFLSARVAAKELGSNKDYITRWHRELLYYGFIVVITPGHLGVEGKGKAPQVRLTDCWHAGQPPTRDFERWNGIKFRHEKKQNPVPQTGDTLSPKVGTVVSLKLGTPWAASVPQTGDIRTAPPCPTNWGHN